VLSAAGRPGSIEQPGFAVHHLGVSWSGSGPGRHRSLAYVGAADAYEVAPAAGVTGLQVHAINTVDGPSVGAPRDRVRR
jgi:hypothetical protein